MKTTLLSKVILCLLICNSLPTNAQQRYQIGLSTSSFERDRLEFNQRLNLNYRFAFLFDVSYGTKFQSSWSSDPVYGSAGFSHISETKTYNFNYLTGKIGVMRKITIRDRDYFYCAAKIGVGWEHRNRLIQRDLMKIVDFTDGGYPIYEIADRYETRSIKSYAYSRFDLHMGMNVPITDRLKVNWYCGVAMGFTEVELGNKYTFFRGVLSAGLTYSFGKEVRSKEEMFWTED